MTSLLRRVVCGCFPVPFPYRPFRTCATAVSAVLSARRPSIAIGTAHRAVAHSTPRKTLLVETALVGWVLVPLLTAGVGCTSPAKPSASDRVPERPAPSRERPAVAEPVATNRPTTASPATSQAARAGEGGLLFDGKSLAGWKVLKDGPFEGTGAVRVENGTIILERGRLQTGIAWTGEFPRDEYEVSLEAMRVDGGDFFCGLTFRVGDEPCTLIVGGWGGTVVGLSNVDDQSAAENQTTKGMTFENGHWYSIQLRVTAGRIEAWIGGSRVIDLERAGHKFSVWWEQERVRPFGVSTWDTTGALRSIRVRRLVAHEGK